MTIGNSIDEFEDAIRKFGVVAACEWFGHASDSDFTRETIDHLALKNKQKEFPLLHPKDLKYIPWAFIAEHEEQAKKNHFQTLARLAERGGLNYQEAVAVLYDMPYENVPDMNLEGHLNWLIEEWRKQNE